MHEKNKPLELTLDVPDNIKTTTGILDAVTVGIDANKTITSAKFSYESGESDTASTKGALDIGNPGRSIKAKLPPMKMDVGTNEIVVSVSDKYGTEKEVSFNAEYEVGYLSPYAEAKVEKAKGGIEYVSNELIVRMTDGVTDAEAYELFRKYGGSVVGRIYMLNHYQLRFDGVNDLNTLNNTLSELEKEPSVLLVSNHMVMNANVDSVPNDTKWDSWGPPEGNNWGLEAIDAPNAWDSDTDFKAVKVGVLDTMINPSHEDLKLQPSNLFVSANDDFPTYRSLQAFLEQRPDTRIYVGAENRTQKSKDHGSHVAGIIGAAANNETGVTGVNWHADMSFGTYWWYAKRADNSSVGMYTSDENALLQMSKLIAHGCRVINISVGTEKKSTANPSNIIQKYDDAFQSMEQKGFDFLICKSAGNESRDAKYDIMNRILTGTPRLKSHVLIAGSVRNGFNILESNPAEAIGDWIGGHSFRYRLAGYSNYGDMVDVLAPGSDIYSTYYGNGSYDYKSGTSMASPMAAGVASLAYSVNPDLDHEAVKGMVTNSTKTWCYQHGRWYPIVNAATTVESAKAKKVPKRSPPKVGFVQGIVQDAETGEMIPEVNIAFYNDDEWVYANSIEHTGEYNVFLTPGKYNMICAKQGYKQELIYNVDIKEGETTYNILLRMVGGNGGEGEISGTARNAFNAQGIPNAELGIYKGLNNTSANESDKVASITCDRSGWYSTRLPAGNYTVRGSASGYLDSSSNITVIAGGGQGADENNANQDVVLTPRLNEGEVRFVLTWGEFPADLDSHLVGPAPEGRFHTYYNSKDFYYGGIDYANLDVDDTTSYGPETTSIYKPVNGTYSFYVHDYSNKDRQSGSYMARSGAQVRVYVAGRAEPTVFNVPSSQGTLWKVCKVRGSEITPVNSMSYERDPVAIGGE
ncbi:MAG: S8 family serine peptidase [Clostridiales Family XIII bacterium]|nr:S8 family serine peptidase [Clostridiales Family XIII bacterium]